MNRIDSHHLGALVLRISLGLVFIAHAAMKVFVFTLPGTVGFFESQGFPGWTAYPVVLAEGLGGLALLLGYRTRLVAIGLIPVLAGALMVHAGNGWVFSAPNGGWEFPAFLIAASLVQALLGDGAWALSSARREIVRTRPAHA